MRRHVKASPAASSHTAGTLRARIGFPGLTMLGLVAFLGIGAPSAGAIDTCPNAIFRTGPSAKLPDCRAYELVSPVETGGHPPEAHNFLNIVHAFEAPLINGAADSVTFNTESGPIGGDPGTGFTDRYVANRTPDGWVTDFVGATGGETDVPRYGGVSADHGYYFMRAGADGNFLGQGTLQDPFGGLAADYLHTPTGWQLIATGSLGSARLATGHLITPNATHVIFSADTKLEPNAPLTGLEAVYERTPNGPTKVLSLLPGEVTPTESATYLGSSPDGNNIAFEVGDGSAEFFFARHDGEATYEVAKANGVGVGKKLECTGFAGSATLTYQWLSDGSPIGGATSSAYITTAADEGSVVQCQVSATNADGTSLSASATRVVTPYLEKTFPTRSNTFIAPSVASTPVGTSLTCNAAETNGFSVAYQWLSDGSPIGGATSSTYMPVEADASHSLQCRASVSNGNGVSVNYSQSVSIIFKAVPKASIDPAISNVTDPGNAPQTGDELSCSSGTWSASPSFAYQWLRNGSEIGGANSSSYIVVGEDDGASLQCRVTATNSTASTQAVSKLVFFSSSGLTSETHPFLETFGSAAQPSFIYATSVAIDQSNGDLLVVDPEAGTVSRFKPDGTPDDFSALGTNAISETPEGPIGFPFAEERRRSSVQVAVDNSGTATNGNIYLATGTIEGSRVDIFSSTGAFLGKLDEYKEGADASGSLSAFAERACGVAVAPNGTVYAGDSGGFVHKYVPSANPPTAADNTANFSYPEACTLAAGAGPTAGFVFANSYGGGEGELAKLDGSSGEVKYTVATGVRTVSVDPSSGHVYAPTSSELKEFDASGASPSTVSTTGLTGRGVAIRGSNTNVYVPKEGDANVSVYGPGVPFTPEPPERLSGGGVFGSAQVGGNLFCEAGNWSGSPTFSYQWLRNGEEIAGASSSSYTPTAEDLDKVIQCRLSAENAEGTTIAVDANNGAKLVSRASPVANVSMPEPGISFGGVFGGKVFYSDAPTAFSQFVATPADLYTFDIASGDTTQITTTGDARFVNVSDDGSRVYFVSQSQIGGEGTAGKYNLYLWSQVDGSTRFITTVPVADVTANNSAGANLGTWFGAVGNKKEFDRGRALNDTRSTSDGSVLVFATTGRLTAFDNTEAAPDDCGRGAGETKELEPCQEVYRYDASNDELICVSCPAGAGPAHGDAQLQDSPRPANPISMVHPVANVTEGGDMVFFDSEEGLVPADGNKGRDVYRWKNGAGVALISTGQSIGESFLYAVTPTGSDAVFLTAEKLLPQDLNGSIGRLYDARVAGGFPPPEETVTEPCTGDSCQGAPTAQPGSPSTATASLEGEGNVATKRPRCPNGTRQKSHRGRKRCVKRKHHHHRAGKHRRGKGGPKRRLAR